MASADLASIIQNGFPFDEGVMRTARACCAPLKKDGVDTLILGCTHYPLVAPMLQRILGRDVRLVTAGHALAATAQRVLEAPGAGGGGRREGTYSFLCTGDVDSFRELGTRFLQMPLGDVEHVSCPSDRRVQASPRRPPGGLPLASRPVQADTREAMKAGERDRVAALRLVADALQKDAKAGNDDEVAVLRRERKRATRRPRHIARVATPIVPPPRTRRRR